MKKFLSLILSVIFLFSFSSCGVNNSQKYSHSFLDLFDTVVSITAYDASQQEFDEKLNACYDELKEYARLYDIYNDYDGVVNLKYINENAKNAPVQADKRIIDLLLFGKEAYEISGKKVNICMGSVLSLWHSERKNAAENPQNAKLPDMNELQEKSLHTDINNLIIDEEKSTVYFSDSEMQIDTGAIAKGFAAERICEFIAENGFWQSAVISLGGNIKVIGLKDNKTPFSIGIENPKNANEYTAVVNVKNGESVVTSGVYQRFFTVDGKDYCHIIDPDTLMPAQFVSSVSVISDNSAYCDAMSTALFNMSVADGLSLVNSLDNIEAMWIDKNGDITYSSNFKSYQVR